MTAIVVAAVVHLAAIVLYPRLVMQMTMQGMSHHGERLNRWLHAAPVTPDARRIVRPGPEFAYSACVYELRSEPLHIHVPASPGYWSLSLYAANSDNYLTVRDIDHRNGFDLLLSDAEVLPAGAVRAPGPRGVVLLRRLATDTAAWSAVTALRKEDVCSSVVS